MARWMIHRIRFRAIVCCVSLAWISTGALSGCPSVIAQGAPKGTDPLPPLQTVDAATRSMWLIDGLVIDKQTGRRINRFVVTPGSLSADENGKSAVRWRDNLKREMKAGRLRWPRTSGFSVMRFRVTAEGYRPAMTQKVWRGGPHIRIRVVMAPVKDLN